MPEILIINFAKGRSTTGGVSHAGSVRKISKLENWKIWK